MFRPVVPFYYAPTAHILVWEFIEKRPEDFVGEYDVNKPKRKVGKPKGGVGPVKRVKLELPDDFVFLLNPK